MSHSNLAILPPWNKWCRAIEKRRQMRMLMKTVSEIAL